MNPVLPSLLLLVGNPLTPTPADIAVRAMLTSWGYSVTVADDDAEIEWTGIDVVYAALSVQAASVGDKLILAPVGVLSESDPVLGLPGLPVAFSAQSISIQAVDGGNWITQPFELGPLEITSSPQPMIGNGLGIGRFLAMSPSGIMVLQVVDTDEAVARRVRLPFGEGFDHNSLNADGRELVRRATKWCLHHRMVGRNGVAD